MITLQSIDESNIMEALSLWVKPEQQRFVAPPAGILARSYAYRRHRAICWGIYEARHMVGLALLHDLEEEPACYHLMELLVHEQEQRKGYGSAALHLILAHCRREGKFSRVEVCVQKCNTAAIHIYEKAGFRDTGYIDSDTPDCLILAYELPSKFNGAVEIRLTGERDLENVQRLWASPEVMRFVGFPDGLHQTMEHLQNEWLPWVQNPPIMQHYSIYAQGVGYCGESFYRVDETGLACMDIKLLPCARGKGIAYAALSYALDQAFHVGKAERAYVDPHPENRKALALYASLGFLPAQRPAHLEPWDSTYFELNRAAWEARNGN